MGMFKTAKAVNVAKPAKATKAEVQITGIQAHAEIDALIKALGTIKDTLGTEIKDTAFEHFYTTANGVRPTSFRGIDGTASASVELRKRATTSPLSVAEVELLTASAIPTEKLVAAQKMFGINPKYSENTELLALVEDALGSIVPEDFIVVQEERSKYVVTDASIATAFAKANLATTDAQKDTYRDVVRALTVLAIKPKLANTDIVSIMDHVKTLIAATPIVITADDEEKVAA